MAFCEKTHLILMDNASDPLKLSELQDIRKTGINTIVDFLYWRETEKKYGELDWSATDTLIERNSVADFKTILFTYDLAPEFFPADWYQKGSNGNIYNDVGKYGWSILSPWNVDAQAASARFIQQAVKRYDSDTVLCVAAFGKEGESLLIPGEHAWYDRSAQYEFRQCFNRGLPSHRNRPAYFQQRKDDAQVADWVRCNMVEYFRNTQSLFRETWTCLHTAYSWDAGCFFDDIYPEYPSLWSILWTFFPHGPLMHPMVQTNKKYNIRCFAGAEYVTGLREHTPMAKEMGLQGLIVGPTHPYQPERTITKWMLDEMEWSVNQWPSS